jgi:hypothetical protein
MELTLHIGSFEVETKGDPVDAGASTIAVSPHRWYWAGGM